MLIALCFKVAVAPFHIWTPDVYEGAPTPVTGFMSVGPKAAGFRRPLSGLPDSVSLRSRTAGFCHLADRRADDDSGQCHRRRAAEHQEDAGLFLDRACRLFAVAFAAPSDRGISAALFYLLAYS